ncbi:alpha/beta fold hydrolase [Sulfitobacter sp. AS59]|uniref:alpha/beta hydrolase family protein n=1 Tax=Sulfitobacter sp. AS59 TaxID=3135784 RepID=UPI00317E0501
MHNRIDIVRPDAPSLAARGHHPVGVTTHEITIYEGRTLTTEIWYPAHADTVPGTEYPTLTRDGVTPTVLRGSACRNALPTQEGFAPLVVISHGYPGNRYLLAHLAESLAAKGYVVAAPDHAGSTYEDQQPFEVTLVHRPLDQRGVIDGMAQLGGDLGALVNCEKVGLIGYSMGGYGALIMGGAGLAPTALNHTRAGTDDMLSRHLAGSGTHAALRDPRLKAIIPIGPWGNGQNMWDAECLAQLDTPMFMMAGTSDEVSNYRAMRRIFEGASADRYLLSFQGAGHNAAAPIPAPDESWPMSDTLGWHPFSHYADPVWDTLRMNNVAQHFAAAFLGVHLRGEDTLHYLDGTTWRGFDPGTSVGLVLEYMPATQRDITSGGGNSR